MNNQEVSIQLQRILSLAARAHKATGEDIDLQGQWAAHLCILIAGFVENSVKELYGDYIRSHAEVPVANYAMSQLNRLQNPKAEKLLEVAKCFKEEWRVSLHKFLSDDGRKEAIDSIMNNRNQIAHGRSVTISLRQVETYLHKIADTFRFVEEQCAA